MENSLTNFHRRMESQHGQTRHGQIVAKVAIGHEAVDDGLGVLILAHDGTDFAVFVNGGALPDGRDVARFVGSAGAMAFEYFLEVSRDLLVDHVEALEG